MTTTIKGTYGVTIRTRNDNDGFDVAFLYNIGTQLHQTATGDVSDMKTYKSFKTAQRKADQYFIKQGV